MAETTAIAWTNSTWNPWRGCHKVSPGCASCYMFRDQERYGRDPNVVVRASAATFTGPLKWAGPKFVFTCSWSDFFVDEADPWRGEAWNIIRRTPHLTYQVLTKRPERIREHLPADWGGGWSNVWLGVSIENQHWTSRLNWLMQIPAKVRFVSAEPLLAPLNLRPWLNLGYLNWTICGGESGGRPGHPPRHMDLDWVRSLRDQCLVAGVPFFYKQGVGPRPGMNRLLDGRTWDEMPAGIAEPVQGAML